MKKPNTPTWRIDLTEEQFGCLMRGMEFYSRIIAGQLEELSSPYWSTSRHISPETLAKLKSELFPELKPNESYPWDGIEEKHNGYYSEWHDHLKLQNYK